jgi:pyruvate/2-oxoglutarate dehydrogenase complex dihydrolipoamide dehydrogenase (E3) component
MKKFDAIIIGSGQVGTPLVFDLAARGKKVAFIEKNKVGGTCLNVGCTPTKTYVASARRMWDIANSSNLESILRDLFQPIWQKLRGEKTNSLVIREVEFRKA